MNTAAGTDQETQPLTMIMMMMMMMADFSLFHYEHE
jgi:hypothetical protein